MKHILRQPYCWHKAPRCCSALLLLCVLETGLLSHSKPTGVPSCVCWAEDQRSAGASAGTLSPCPQDVYSIEILAGSQASVLQIEGSQEAVQGGRIITHVNTWSYRQEQSLRKERSTSETRSALLPLLN